MTQIVKSLLLISIFFLGYSCATFDKTQQPNIISETTLPGTNIYLMGDAGYIENDHISEAINALNEKIKNSKKEDVLLFLGDNIYPKGMPENKTDINRQKAEQSLQAQLKTAKNFKGKIIFIPGNHDWYSGVDGLSEEEKMVEEALGKNSFQPENGCPLVSYEPTLQLTRR